MIHGKPTYPENTLPAFRNAAAHGWVLEFDVKLTKDRVPVVIHDPTLDRVTNCTGLVAGHTLAELRGCRVDVLGSPGSGLPARPAPRSRSALVPRLDQVLRLARRRGARINLEIKNAPTDPDFDATPAFANRVMDAVLASGIPPSHVIIQSFWPADLPTAHRRMPGAEISLLTLAAVDDGGPAAAAAIDADWVSPSFPIGSGLVTLAHSLGQRVVPYTLDTPGQVTQAAALGVDAVITDDPAMARGRLRQAYPARPTIPAAPGRSTCRAAEPTRSAGSIKALAPEPGAPRVFAMQFKQDLRNVRDYAAFRTRIECMLLRYVVPDLAKDAPNVVAFNEDVGLMTVATGARGALARGLFGRPGGIGCEPQGVPCSTLVALAAVTAAYGPQVAAYRVRFPTMAPVSTALVAATDTFARGWMQVFSDMARRYGVYIVGSGDQPGFRETSDPAEVALFADPDARPRPRTAFVATSPEVYNEVFMWGPHDVRHEGPAPLRNVVASNRKVPLTDIENAIELTNGPSTGADAVENLRPYRLPGTRAKLGFATSLPAFVYGSRPPRGVDPCTNTARWYMRCLDRLGANVVIQDEANPGRWGAAAAHAWQPLEWMTSTWRAVADRDVGFDYNVTPHLVGNLADLPFDGQTAITQRGLRAPQGAPGPAKCTYVGNGRALPEDPAGIDVGGQRLPTRRFTGPKREFLALAPWVAEGDRASLRSTAARLAPGSGDPLENDYLETAIAADLTFPPDPRRPACAGQR
ncbi:MAG: hypothetical protein QOG62_411 [Thermoleophilaceae bacterium]|nr:hypothetical protein [Thermoleophilaceae bacterium]